VQPGVAAGQPGVVVTLSVAVVQPGVVVTLSVADAAVVVSLSGILRFTGSICRIAGVVLGQA